MVKGAGAYQGVGDGIHQVQLIILGSYVTAECRSTPMSHMNLIAQSKQHGEKNVEGAILHTAKISRSEASSQIGTAILSFSTTCDKTIDLVLGIGCYMGSSLQSFPIDLEN